MKNALNNQVGMLGDMFLRLVANLKQGVIYFIKQALPPNISAGSVGSSENPGVPVLFGGHNPIKLPLNYCKPLKDHREKMYF